MSDQTSGEAGEALPECGKYELLRDHEDARVLYKAGEVLEFN